MNQRSTVVLLGLLVAGGLFWALRTVVTPTVPAIPTSVETIRATAAPEALLRLIVRGPGEVVILERQANSNVFGLPGGWPVREAEVTQLLDLFRNLDTRFGAIPITEDTDLSSFGLGDSQKPLVVELVTESGTTAIQFGEPPLVEGENPFARPTYLRIGEAMEVVRLGPDALPILTRPLSAYRKRQLFADTQRIKIGTSTRVIPGTEVDGVRITAPAESFTLKRLAPLPVTDGSVTPNQLALSWEITAPVVDRLDPAALEQVLVSLPELWA